MLIDPDSVSIRRSIGSSALDLYGDCVTGRAVAFHEADIKILAEVISAVNPICNVAVLLQECADLINCPTFNDSIRVHLTHAHLLKRFGGTGRCG